MGYRFEVWSHPSTGDFHREVLRLPVISAKISISNSGRGSGRIMLPPRFPTFNILRRNPIDPTLDVRSVIRIFEDTDDENPIVEVVPVKVPDAINPSRPIELTCVSIEESFFGDATVWAWDHPVWKFPDWVWGGPNILANPDFEDGLITPTRYTMWDDATGGSWDMIINGTTVTIPWNATAISFKTLLVAAGFPETEVRGSGTEADPFDFSISDPYTPVITFNEGALTGGGLVAGIVALGRKEPTAWHQSFNPTTGELHGQISEFRLTETPPDTAPFNGAHALVFNGNDIGPFDYPGAQQEPLVIPGAIYQGKFRMRTSAADQLRFVIRTMVEGDPPIGKDEGTPTPNTWDATTLFEIPNIIIPDGVDQVIFRGAYIGGGDPGRIYLDAAELREGLPPANAAEIFNALMDDCVLNHAADVPPRVILDFIDYTTNYGLVNDADGVPWAELLSWRVTRGTYMYTVLEGLRQEFGIEYALRWNQAAGMWRLSLWNPDGRGADNGVAIVVGIDKVTAGPVAFDATVGNAVLAEGANFTWARAEDTGSIGAVGRIERYAPLGNVLSQDSLDLAAQEQLTENLEQGLSVTIQHAPGAGPQLLTTIGLGDTVTITVPNLISQNGYRLDQIDLDWRRGDSECIRTGTYSRAAGALSGQAAVNQMVAILARRAAVLPPPEVKPKAPPGATGGGMMTVTVAAVDSTAHSKRKADFQCTGVDDHIIIQQALDVCAGFGGTVWLAEGAYLLQIGDTDAAIVVPPTVTLAGVAPGYDGGVMLEMQNLTDPGRLALVRMRGHSEVRNITMYAFNSALGIELTDFEGFMKITDCWIETRNGAAIEGLESNEVWVERNLINVWATPTTEADSGIHITTAGIVDLWITRNWILGGWHGIFLDGDQGRNFIHDNYISQSWFSGIRLRNNLNPIFATSVTGNVISIPGVGSDGTTGEAAIYVSADGADIDPTTAQSNGLIIADNIIEVAATCHGIRLTDVCLVNVHDNYIEQQGLHGIFLEDANGCQVHDNTIQEPGFWPALSYDGIHLVTSDDNYIRANTIVERRGGSPWYYRYAINISNAACDRNIVVGNDLRLAGSGTGFINNAGTGTRTVYPGAAPPVGDNFV